MINAIFGREKPELWIAIKIYIEIISYHMGRSRDSAVRNTLTNLIPSHCCFPWAVFLELKKSNEMKAELFPKLLADALIRVNTK